MTRPPQQFAKTTRDNLLKFLTGLSPRTVATQALWVKHPMGWTLDPPARVDIDTKAGTITIVFAGERLLKRAMRALLCKMDGTTVELNQGMGLIQLTRVTLEEEGWTGLVFEFV